MRMGGLEHHNGAYILEHCLTGYSSEGSEMSYSWQEVIRAITEAYCSRDNNEDKYIKSLVA